MLRRGKTLGKERGSFDTPIAETRRIDISEDRSIVFPAASFVAGSAVSGRSMTSSGR
jgi:hypothetical protein